ncbi:solute carrier family 22 member 20-like [Eumetopias jubatus]|uniref:solute carrier family 22 member 20-like n=1 Tax=Eumetopias jubatus TaxID=34886 RepID=UPI00101679D7|nr:solute carrier family 22 member 20-like [Eumetopias jubatus]
MGNFQILQTVLMMFPAILIACHSFLQNFTATTPEHHCRPTNWTNGSHVPDGVGDGDLLQVFIPLDKDQKPERCLRFSEPHWQILNLNGTSSLSLDTEACLDGWVYDQTVGSSIVSEWDLVCEHKSLKSIAQSIYMTGQLVGATAFGIFSDSIPANPVGSVINIDQDPPPPLAIPLATTRSSCTWLAETAFEGASLLLPILDLAFCYSQIDGKSHLLDTEQILALLCSTFPGCRCGRKTALQSGTLLMIIMGTSAAFAPSFPAYCVLRFLSGVAMTGIIITSLCLAMEWTPTQKRTLVNIYTMYMITLGQVVLTGLAYLIQQWRWLQGTVSVAYVIILLYSWGLPESACWLITHNKPDKAVKNLQTVARLNGRKEQGRKLTPEVVRIHVQEDTAAVKESPFFLDLFRTPGLCRITCCIALGWFSTGFSFYGLGLDVQRFGFNIYWTQVLFTVVDIPTKLMTGLSMAYFGRRITTVSLLLVAGCTILVTAFLPQDMNTFQMILCLLGKGSLAGCFSCLYLYTMELFPTEVRQIGMSAGIFSTRLGSLLSPMVYILGNHSPLLQPVIFGLVPIVAAVAGSFLMETNNQPLLNTIQETEKRIKMAQDKQRNISENITKNGLATLLPEKTKVECTV